MSYRTKLIRGIIVTLIVVVVLLCVAYLMTCTFVTDACSGPLDPGYMDLTATYIKEANNTSEAQTQSVATQAAK